MLQVVRVQKREGGAWQYLVHYKGYGKVYDEWLESNRLMPLTPENESLAAKLSGNEEKRIQPRGGPGADDAEDEEGPGSAKKSSKKLKDNNGKPVGKAEGGPDGAMPSANAPALGEGDKLSGRKRGVDALNETEGEEGNGTGPHGAVRLSMPYVLKRLVVEDWELVNTRQYIPRVPVPNGGKTAAQLCEAYLAYLRGEDTPASSSSSSAAAAGTAGGKAGSSSATKAKAKPGSSSGGDKEKDKDIKDKDKDGASGSGGGGGSKGERRVSSTQYKATKEVLDALLNYFDSAFPIYCLYRYERMAFDAWFRERRHETPASVAAWPADASSAASTAPAVAPVPGSAAPSVFAAANVPEGGLPLSQLAGPEHLLRLLARMPASLGHVNASREELDLVAGILSDFLK